MSDANTIDYFTRYIILRRHTVQDCTITQISNPYSRSLMKVRQVFIGCRACFRGGIIFSLWSYLYSLIFLVKSIIYQGNDGWAEERKQEK